jgi:arylsulfatase A-like enzyme
MGKWHLGDEIFPQHGFEEWEAIEDNYPKQYSPERDPSLRSSYYWFLRERGYQPDLPSNQFSRDFASRLPIEHAKPRFLEEKATDFIRRHRHQPFLLHVNFLEPHPPYWGPFNDQHPVDQIELPPSYAIPLGDDEPLAYRIRRLTDRMLRPQGIDLSTDDGWRRLIAHYWGNVTHIDRAVGGILRTLEELGLAENTIVVYTADHGEMLGAHSMHRKEILYEESAKVPLLMRIPAQGRKQAMVEGRFSQLDLAPTLLELMSQPVPDNLQGRSLLPAVRRGRSEEPVFIVWQGPPTQFSGDEDRLHRALAELASGGAEPSPEEATTAIRANTRAVISAEGWKLCLSDGDRHQLFHLERDPGETRNLFYTRRHDDVVRRLTRRLHQWQRGVGDPVAVEPT